MSKESLRQLNESLAKHFKENGIKNALYYEPLFDYYWKQNDKIGLCNLESYDKEIQGIQKISVKRILDYWSNAQTIQKSLKIFRTSNKGLLFLLHGRTSSCIRLVFHSPG